MTEKQRINEEKVFDAIQDLKDSVFGLKNSYVRFCYSDSESGRFWDNSRVDIFIDEIIENAKKSSYYKSEFASDIKLILELILKFIHKVCPFEDQRFVSIRKIVKTAEKPTTDYKSVFEIMIETQNQYFDMEYQNKCNELFLNITGIDFQSFYKCIKHGIEAFIDSKGLNILNDDDMTREVLARIKRVTNITTMEVRKYADTNGVFDYE